LLPRRQLLARWLVLAVEKTAALEAGMAAEHVVVVGNVAR